MKITILALLLSTLCLTTAAYGDPKAGFMTTEGVTLLAGDDPLRVTVWYPTSNKKKGPSEYLSEPGSPFELRLPAGATRDAPIKGGTFPLIVFNPGGGDSGDFKRILDFPTAELLAADGYIVVNAARNNGLFEAQGPLQSGLIDYMLSGHPLRDSIDADKIGLRGLSFGGHGAGSVAGGDTYGNPPDPRVRGVIIDEGFGVCVGTFCESVTIPMLLRDGSDYGEAPPFLGDDIGEMASEFALLQNSFPRFLISLENPAHSEFHTATCPFNEALRLASLAYQAGLPGGIVEPEPRNASYFFTAIGLGDGAGAQVSFLWNQATLFPGIPNLQDNGDWCQPQYGGPLTPGVGTTMDSATMLEAMYVLDRAFWETVFGNGNPTKTKLEKATETLDSVVSIIAVKE